jgi:signal transduction histidine kinase/ligand-binding sensor domain-containing protein
MSLPYGRRLLRCLLAAACGALAGNACALDPASPPWRYAHTAWRVQDGDLPGAALAMTESPDGFLWIGTTQGPVRFDGRTFLPLQAGGDDTPLLAGEPIYTLLSASDGSLWLGGEHGAWRWRSGQLRRFENRARANVLREDGARRVWFSRTRRMEHRGSALACVDGDTLRYFGAGDGLRVDGAAGFAIAPDGTFWIASPDGVVHWDGRTSRELKVSAPTSENDQNLPQALEIGRDGGVYVGFDLDLPGYGLQRVVGDRLQVIALQGAGKRPHVSALLLDREGTLWVGTEDDGLYRLHDGRTDHFGIGDGLSSDTVNAIREDRDGNLWVGTSEGLDRFRDLRIGTLGVRDGLSSELVDALAPAPDGTVWVSDSIALDQVRDGQVVRRLRPHPASGGSAFSKVFVDRTGRLWAGVDDDLAVWADDRFERIRLPDGRPVGPVMDIAQDSSGAIWATTVPSLHRLVRVEGEGERVATELRGDLSFRRLAPRGDGSMWAVTNAGLWEFTPGAPPREFRFPAEPASRHDAQSDLLSVRGLQPGAGGALLIATNHGLVVWREGRMRWLVGADGLPCDNVYGATADRRGNALLYAACGLLRIPAGELDAWWRAGPAGRVQPLSFDTTDGAAPGQSLFGNSAAMDGAGRIWFAGGAHLQFVDPDRLGARAPPPPVYIEAVKVGSEPYLLPGPLRLQANPSTLEIDYTAVDLTAAQKIRFRYRLEGHDAAWQDAGTRRQAFYSDLKPGRYRFHVIAGGPGGAWNEQGAAIELVVPPTFVQSGWFAMLCALAAVLALWLLDRLRQRHLRIRLQAQLGERTRIAGELHDTLLQGAQGLILTLQTHIGRARLSEADRAALDQAIDRAGRLVLESRDRIQDLRAPTRPAAGLYDALKAEGETLSAQTSTAFIAAMRGADRDLRATVRDDLRRLAFEAMTNAFRHGGARTVALELALSDQRLELSVHDDGVGLDPQRMQAAATAGHWGITGMRERARRIGARLVIDSRPGRGTRVQVSLPARRAYPASPWWPWARGRARR